jgi:hypothetical protein
MNVGDLVIITRLNETNEDLRAEVEGQLGVVFRVDREQAYDLIIDPLFSLSSHVKLKLGSSEHGNKLWFDYGEVELVIARFDMLVGP